jgi:predicted RNA methylase
VEYIGDAALRILASATVDGNRVKLNCPQLARELYEEVNEVLERLGGKWQGGRTRAHIFPYEIEETLRLVVESGEMPPKNPLAYFATPAAVVEEMISYINTDTLTYDWDEINVLEPSAGDGAIARYLREIGYRKALDLIEPDPFRAKLLRQQNLGDVYEMTFEDFIQKHPNRRYSYIFMNPPFTLPGNKVAWVDHIRLAWSILKPGGELVAIAPNSISFNSNKHIAALRELVYDWGRWDDLGPDAFKESGTGTQTVSIHLVKPPEWQAEREDKLGEIISFVKNHLLQPNDSQVLAKVKRFVKKWYEHTRPQFANIRLKEDDWRFMEQHYLEVVSNNLRYEGYEVEETPISVELPVTAKAMQFELF